VQAAVGRGVNHVENAVRVYVREDRGGLDRSSDLDRRPGEAPVGVNGYRPSILTGVAAAIDPDAEDAYWRDNYSSRPYATGGTYDDYGPAYRYGVDGYGQHQGRKFDEVESELSRDWERAKGSSKLTWDNAKHATRDSWQRVSDAVERAVPGDSDRDGK